MNALKQILKVLLLTIIMTIVYTAASALVLPDTAAAVTPEEQNLAFAGIVVINLVNVLLLAYVVRLSRWSGLALLLGLTFSYYGINTFVGQIEALAFLTDLGEILGSGSEPLIPMPVDFITAMFIIGIPLAVVGVPLVVLFFGRGRKETAEEVRLAPSMDAGQWAWKLAAVIVVYELLYFGFGYYVAWNSEALVAFYQGTDPGSFPAMLWQNAVNTPLIYLWQALRALLWVAFALPVIMMLRDRGWKGALGLGLLLALPMNLPHIIPNPYMPPAVRLAHFVETTSSNFLFGLFLFWLLHRAHPSVAALFGGKGENREEGSPQLRGQAT